MSNGCQPCSYMVQNCKQCINNIFDSANGFSCTKCEHPYVLKNRRCQQFCNISNCLLCKNVKLCQTCERNYTAFNSQCVLCSFVMTNCLECSDLTTCTACIPNTACFLADIAPNNSSSPSNGTVLNGTNSSSSPANPVQNNNNPNNTSLSGNLVQGSSANADAQSLSSVLMSYAAGLVSGSIVTAIVVLIVKKMAAPVSQRITVANSALNVSASEAKETRIENLQESFNNIHSFEESPPNVSGSPPRKGGRQPSTRMPLESKRKILKINEEILEDSYQ